MTQQIGISAIGFHKQDVKLQFAEQIFAQVTVGEAISLPPRGATACFDEWYFVGHATEPRALPRQPAEFQFSNVLTKTDSKNDNQNDKQNGTVTAPAKDSKDRLLRGQCFFYGAISTPSVSEKATI